MPLQPVGGVLLYSCGTVVQSSLRPPLSFRLSQAVLFLQLPHRRFPLRSCAFIVIYVKPFPPVQMSAPAAVKCLLLFQRIHQEQNLTLSTEMILMQLLNTPRQVRKFPFVVHRPAHNHHAVIFMSQLSVYIGPGMVIPHGYLPVKVHFRKQDCRFHKRALFSGIIFESSKQHICRFLRLAFNRMQKPVCLILHINPVSDIRTSYLLYVFRQCFFLCTIPALFPNDLYHVQNSPFCRRPRHSFKENTSTACPNNLVDYGLFSKNISTK